MFRSLSFLVLSLCVSAYLAPVAFGQGVLGDSDLTTQTPPTDSSGNTSSSRGIRTVAVADVNVGGVSVNEVGNTVTGTFSLFGKMGWQNRIVTGLVVQDEQGAVLDVVPLKRDISIQKGELRTESFSYTFPGYLSGTVTLRVWAETEGGLLLGIQPIVQKTFPDTVNPLRCTSEEQGTRLSCSGNGETVVSHYSGSFFALPTDETSLILSDSPTVLTHSLPAGRYRVLLRDTATKHLTVASLRVLGTMGHITNAVVHENEIGENVLTAATDTLSPTGNVLSAILRSATGAVCAEVKKVVDAPAMEFTLPASCTSGTLALALTGPDGKILDTLEESFAVSDASTSSPSTPSVDTVDHSRSVSGGSLWVVLSVVGIVLLLGALWVLHRRRATSAVILFGGLIVGSALVVPVDEVHALSLSASTWGPEGCSPCEIGISVGVAISTDKATYSPGESMTVTASYWINKDHSGFSASDRGSVTVGYKYDYGNRSTQFDVDLGAEVSPAYAYYDFDLLTVPSPWAPSDTFVESIPTTMTPGSHFLSQRLLVSQMNWRGVLYSYEMAIDRLYFNVAIINEPIGDVNEDWGDCTNGVYGWACDKDSPNAAIDVHVYDGSTFLGSTTANLAGEAAIGTVCGGGSSDHRFYFPIPVSMRTGTNQQLSVYGINIGPTGSNNPYIDAKTINCPVPTVDVYFP